MKGIFLYFLLGPVELLGDLSLPLNIRPLVAGMSQTVKVSGPLKKKQAFLRIAMLSMLRIFLNVVTPLNMLVGVT